MVKLNRRTETKKEKRSYPKGVKRPTKLPSKAGKRGNKNGRPRAYSEALAKKICDKMAGGKTLSKICKLAKMPAYQTVIDWTNQYPEFKLLYQEAKDKQMDAWAEQIVDLSDDSIMHPAATGKAKLQVDTRKWLMSKLKSKRYGDKTILTGEDGGPVKFIVEYEDKPQVDESDLTPDGEKE
ncbi:MAG: hypothetical protein WC302_00925 [Candidatus Paceibacterota bacterium]|jgi:hypothetical protein